MPNYKVLGKINQKHVKRIKFHAETISDLLDGLFVFFQDTYIIKIYQEKNN